MVGTVLEASPPNRLVMTFASPGEQPITGPSQVTFDVESYDSIVRLTVTHENLLDQAEYEASAAGWAAVLSNLKSFIETGHPLSQPPWELHTEPS
ncbi:SRPBCC domain-containing protein [Kribbella pittospori]|uniref:SRPBCC domain-containing protein n=1 Tax=Kribbella pittospori TaxID=722689 RepID=UPI00192D791D|nr:SRPBCC domain-containing protein [Kribbella pittospori]